MIRIVDILHMTGRSLQIPTDQLGLSEEVVVLNLVLNSLPRVYPT